MPGRALALATVAAGADVGNEYHPTSLLWSGLTSTKTGKRHWSHQESTSLFGGNGDNNNNMGGGGNNMGGNNNNNSGNGNNGGNNSGNGDGSGKTLTFTTQAGKSVQVSGESRDKCISSCENAPELKDTNQGGGLGDVMNAATGGERQALADCMRFCRNEFELFCFPGDSSVIVRNRGRVPLAKLRQGDAALAVRRCQRSGRWALHFDMVIAWIHHDADAQGEVLQIRHEAGHVQLTASHMLFVLKADRPEAEPLLAREVAVGDRLLAPWIDGSIATPQVLAIDAVQKRGLYAPLLAGGTIVVDGTAASCYALPRNIAESPTLRFAGLAEGGATAHAASHALFLPLRALQALQCTATGSKMLGSSAELMPHEETPDAKQAMACSETAVVRNVHPYAWALYIVTASCLT